MTATLKTKFPILILICALLLAGAFMSGCSLFGPSVEKAQEVAEKRQSEMDSAVADFKAAEAELTDVLAKLDQAIRDDDKNAIEKLTAAAQVAGARYEATKEAAHSAESLFRSAVADFKDAKSTSDYVGTVFGWITAAISSILGGGALWSRKRAGEALTGVTEALEKTKSDPSKWPEARAVMTSKLSGGALKLIDKVRP